MNGDNRFLLADPPIDQPCHYLVALGIQPPLRTRLRNAICQLSVAEVMIWRNRNLLRSGYFSIRRIRPVHMELPGVDSIILEDLFKLRSACRHHDVWRALRRKLFAVQVRIVQEVDAVYDHALLRGRLALQHFRSIRHAGMLLDHVVSGAGWNVVTVRPDGGPRVIREEGSKEFVTV